MEDIDDSLLFDLVRDKSFEAELPDPAVSFTLTNPLCGDEVTFFLLLNDLEELEKISFKTKGCFLCKASAAALAKSSNSQPKSVVLSVIEKFRSEFMTAETSSLNSPEFIQLHELRKYPTRAKCVLLPFEALAKLLG